MQDTIHQLLQSLITEREIPVTFSDACWQEANESAQAERLADTTARTDITNTPLVTIDGENAHDFDDAVCCQPTADGGYLITVAIADVSHFVTPLGEMDEAAAQRGNSVYLPDRVIPMLPEPISNGICSLNQQQKKHCVVCEMQVKEGRVLSDRFFLGIMQSHQRLTYQQCDELITTKKSPMLTAMATAAMAMRHVRSQQGGMLLNSPEKKCQVENGNVTFCQTPRLTSHFVIEELMIATNICAGKLLLNHKAPALYRAHRQPDAAKLASLQIILSDLNLRLPNNPDAADFSRLISDIETHRPALFPVLLPYILGTLSRAFYTVANDIGHFGLANQCYLHFTSPIRRYPDLINHRALVSVLKKQPPPYGREQLQSVAEHCTATETRADKLEWACYQRLACHQHQNLQGCSFDGVVSGVSRLGFFVFLPDVNLDGLVRFSSLKGYWQQKDDLPIIVRRDNGDELRLGNEVHVRVKSINPTRGQVDLLLQHQ